MDFRSKCFELAGDHQPSLHDFSLVFIFCSMYNNKYQTQISDKSNYGKLSVETIVI